MVSNPRPHTFARLLQDLGTWGHLTVLWVCIGVIALLTLLVTIFERKHNPDFPKTWHAGLAEAFYYVVSLALTGKSAYKGFPGALGRLTLVVWMLAGMVMVAHVTSTITSAMTVEKLKGPESRHGAGILAACQAGKTSFLNRDLSKKMGVRFRSVQFISGSSGASASSFSKGPELRMIRRQAFSGSFISMSSRAGGRTSQAFWPISPSSCPWLHPA